MIELVGILLFVGVATSLTLAGCSLYWVIRTDTALQRATNPVIAKNLAIYGASLMIAVGTIAALLDSQRLANATWPWYATLLAGVAGVRLGWMIARRITTKAIRH